MNVSKIVFLCIVALMKGGLAMCVCIHQSHHVHADLANLLPRLYLKETVLNVHRYFYTFII